MGNPGYTTEKHIRRKSAVENVLSDPSGRFTPKGEIARPNERSALDEAAERIGESRSTMNRWASDVAGTEYEPNWKLWPGRQARRRAEPSGIPSGDLAEAIKKAAGRPSGAILEGVVQETGATLAEVLDAIDALKAQGVAIKRIGDRYELNRTPSPAFAEEHKAVEIISDDDNRFLFGAIGDNHAASKYERLDVLNDLYDQFEKRGITKVLHGGNWIDGEARFNKQDIVAYGIEEQCRYLAKTYPRRAGIDTYAIWGDDHEGWYTREGIDVGRYAEDVMQREGRDDWHNLGFMEAHIRLVNKNTGAIAICAVAHPGGGSSYATSYKPQKIIEAMDGGEKPGVILIAHYHKLEIINVRNVWCLQVGCTQDQTVFGRKKGLDFHVGGIRVDLEQDPETGAIIECNGMRRYFNRAYYVKGGLANERWSKHGPIKAVPRSAGGV